MQMSRITLIKQLQKYIISNWDNVHAIKSNRYYSFGEGCLGSAYLAYKLMVTTYMQTLEHKLTISFSFCLNPHFW